MINQDGTTLQKRRIGPLRGVDEESVLRRRVGIESEHPRGARLQGAETPARAGPIERETRANEVLCHSSPGN
jgi:hypothetical protein